jgi:hypothetical protein
MASALGFAHQQEAGLAHRVEALQRVSDEKELERRPAA